MPAIAPLSINDGQATPVAHSFVPVTTDGSVAKFAEKTAGIPLGYYILTHEVRQPKSDTGAIRVLTSLAMPTTQTVNGVLSVVRNSSAQVTFNFAQDSTDQERKDLTAYVRNFLSNATVVAANWGVEPFY